MALNINLPGDIVFGSGSFQGLGKRARSLGMSRPLVVGDRAMTGLGLTGRAAELAGEAGAPCPVYDGCVENPRAGEVAEAVEAYRAGGCDGVIAVGGGSVIDVAKAVRVVIAGGGAILDYDMAKGGIKKIGRGLPPMIAAPTTAGSGSEATLGAVILDPATAEKVLVFSPAILPTCALLDPELTVTLPASVTAATGMDALVHAIEAYTAPAANPLADALCRAAFDLVGKSLPRAVARGDDLEARGDMMMAALMGGMAFAAKGLGAVHALSHQLSGHCGLPHGLANAVMLPQVMAHNAGAVGDKYLEVVRAMGLRAGDARQAAGALADFARGLGLPGSLAGLGVPEDLLPRMAAGACHDLALRGNPTPCDQAQLVELYRRAL